jgi:hypothetical protein
LLFHNPLLVGIKSGSSLAVKKPVALTCSTEYTSSTQSIEWLVNAEHNWEDVNLLTEAGQIISNMMFVPQIGDVVVECKVKGKQDRSSNVSITVQNEVKIFNLQKSKMSKTKRVLWIPFDIDMFEINRLESSGEETGVTYSRDIYKYMEDMPSDAADSYKFKRRPKLEQKKVNKFVDEIHPISLFLLSGSSLSSGSLMSAQFLVLLMILLFCIL